MISHLRDRPIGASDDSVLYHYTTQSGLLGIARTGELWASKIQFLNDHSEFNLAFSEARALMKQIRKQSSATDRYEFLDHVDHYLELCGDVNVFVASFSAAADLLSQWRAYGGDSIGYAIGIKRDYIESIANKQGFNLHKCTYDRGDCTRVIGKLLTDAFKQYHNSCFAKGFDLTEFRNAKIDNLLNAISEFSPTYKHAAFHEEQEWRLIAKKPMPRPQIFSRESKIGLIPTWRIDLRDAGGKVKVHELIQGPAPDRDRAFAGLNAFCWEHGNLLEVANATASVTPFRSLR